MSAGTHGTASAPVPCAGAASICCPLDGGCPQAVPRPCRGCVGVVTSARGGAGAHLAGCMPAGGVQAREVDVHICRGGRAQLGVDVHIWGWVCTSAQGCACAQLGGRMVRGGVHVPSAPQATGCPRAGGKAVAEPALSLSPSRGMSPLCPQFPAAACRAKLGPPKPALGALSGALPRAPLAHSTHREPP